MNLSEIISDIKQICEAFKLGEYIGSLIGPHTVAGYGIAKFQTTTGNYEYIYKS